MEAKQKQTTLDALAGIEPGVNYPVFAKVVEPPGAPVNEIEFLLNSFYVGMYCAIHVNGATMPHQTGDHDNKKFVRGLKRDLLKAVERGATVTIGPIRPCKLTMDE